MDFMNDISIYQLYKDRFIDFYERLLMGDVDVLMFLAIILFPWFIFSIDFYLNLRQRKVIKQSIIPPADVLAIMSKENYTRARYYALEKNIFHIYSSWYHIIKISFMLFFDFMQWLWSFSVKSTKSWREGEIESSSLEWDLSEGHEVRACLMFIFYLTTFTLLDSIPWKFYNTYIMEEKYGFIKKPPLLFVINQLKSLGITFTLIIPFCYFILSVINFDGRYFYFQAWLFSSILMLFLMIIYPDFVAPIFDSYFPLPEGSLKESIKHLAKLVEFPLTNVFMVHNSKRASHSNAFLYGNWNNKRVILFDNLLKSLKFSEMKRGDDGEINKLYQKGDCTEKEIVSIIAHEFGHWKFSHITQNLIIGQLNLFIVLVVSCNLFNYGVLFKALGFKEVGTPDLIKLVLIIKFLLSPYNALLQFILTFLSRQNEFQADNFVVRLHKGENLINALIKLENNRIRFPIHDKWYSTFYNSHPSILERMEAMYETGLMGKNI